MFCKVNIMALGGLEAADAPKNEKMAALPSFAQCTRVLPCALSSLEFILCWPLAAWRSFDVTHHTHPVYRQNDENPRLFVYAHRPSQATGRKRWYPCSSPARGSRDSRDPSFASCPGTPTALPPTSAPRSPRSAFAPRVSTPETGRWAVVSCRNPCPALFVSLSLGSCWRDWCCSEALVFSLDPYPIPLACLCPRCSSQVFCHPSSLAAHSFWCVYFAQPILFPLLPARILRRKTARMFFTGMGQQGVSLHQHWERQRTEVRYTYIRRVYNACPVSVYCVQRRIGLWCSTSL